MSLYRLAMLATSPRKQGEADYAASFLRLARLTGKGDRVSGGRGTKKGRCTKFLASCNSPF